MCMELCAVSMYISARCITINYKTDGWEYSGKLHWLFVCASAGKWTVKQLLEMCISRLIQAIQPYNFHYLNSMLPPAEKRELFYRSGRKKPVRANAIKLFKILQFSDFCALFVEIPECNVYTVNKNWRLWVKIRAKKQKQTLLLLRMNINTIMAFVEF